MSCSSKLPFGCKCKGAYIIFGIMIVIIIIYWIILMALKNNNGAIIETDFMNHKVIDLPGLENCCSWWPISHFILFLILGILFPECDVLIITAGILWELFEMLMASITASGRQPVRACTGCQLEYSDNWWAGSFKDIIMNVAGFYTGKAYITYWRSYVNYNGQRDKFSNKKNKINE